MASRERRAKHEQAVRRSRASAGCAPSDVAYATFESALGTCGVAWTKRGLCDLLLPERTAAQLRRRLRERFGSRAEREPTPTIAQAIETMMAHLAGSPRDLSRIAVDLEGLTPFSVAVYRALRRVPAGQTVSYAELARRAGSPAALRAVGGAMARNPVPLVVPCHRVVAASGQLGGFSAHGGAVTKAKLLRGEGVDLEALGSSAARSRRSGGNEGRAPGGRRSQSAKSKAKGPGSGTAQLPFDTAKARRRLYRADTELGKLMRRVGPFRLKLKRPPTTFAALAEAIVYQQLTGKAAATIFARLRERCGATGPALGPADVLRASDATLRAAGLSGSKTKAVRELAERSQAGQVPSLTELGRMDDQRIVERLSALRGIGPWTVQMLLIFTLGRPDVLPSADYGVRKGFARAFGLAELPSCAQLEAHAERWRPYRTMASWYLWRALELPE